MLLSIVNLNGTWPLTFLCGPLGDLAWFEMRAVILCTCETVCLIHFCNHILWPWWEIVLVNENGEVNKSAKQLHSEGETTSTFVPNDEGYWCFFHTHSNYDQRPNTSCRSSHSCIKASGFPIWCSNSEVLPRGAVVQISLLVSSRFNRAEVQYYPSVGLHTIG